MSKDFANELSRSAVSARGLSWAEMQVLSDTQLLDRFVAEGDEVAFEALVKRHGPRVLTICRRELGDGQDAEDAFQATFIILLNRSRSVREIDSVDGWLCGVARRVAFRAKIQAGRKRRREEAPVDLGNVAEPVKAGDVDLNHVVRAEIQQLPEKYRRPIELYYLEGISCEQVALHLSCPAGTLKWRLSRGRELLRGRLSRLGVALTALFLFRFPRQSSAAGSRIEQGPQEALARAANRRYRSGLPQDLAQRTVDLAVLLRNSGMLSPRVPTKSRRPVVRRRSNLLKLGLIGLLVALLLGSYPFVLAVPQLRDGFETLVVPASVSGASSCHSSASDASQERPAP